MQLIIDWILNNKEWFLSGIGAAIIMGLLKLFSKLFGSSSKDDTNISNVINQTVNVSTHDTKKTEETAVTTTRSKNSIQILFIDDNKVSFIPAMKKAGYSSISWIRDCSNIHSQQIKDADVIFVDVNGVGISLFPQEQGFGLAKAIKKQHPTKCVVLYSAEPQYFRKEYAIFDSVLPKNSEPYEFTKIIDDWNQGGK